MGEYELQCETCGLLLDSEKLVLKTSNDRDFSYCPNCGGSDFQDLEMGKYSGRNCRYLQNEG